MIAINFSIDLDNYIQGGLNDYLPYVNNPRIQNVAINLKGFINLVQRNSKAIQVPTSVSNYNSIPSKSFWLSNHKNSQNINPFCPKCRRGFFKPKKNQLTIIKRGIISIDKKMS